LENGLPRTKFRLWRGKKTIAMTKHEYFDKLMMQWEEMRDDCVAGGGIYTTLEKAWQDWKTGKFEIAEPKPFGPFPWDGMN